MKIKIKNNSNLMKKKVVDYQWPSALGKKYNFNDKISLKDNKKKLIKIENFFKKKFGYNVKLFPSGRAAIATIIRFLKINRSNEVFTDKWSSHCLFNTIGAYTNVNTSLHDPDLVICIHKWGKIKKIKVKKNFKIIEDSVDSLIINKRALFPNKGEFEIFSLPKIIGSISGGLVVSKNKKFIKFCSKEQKKNKNLGVYQAREKFNESNKLQKNYNTWLYYESWNTYLEINSLLNIEKCLNNYDLNKNKIIRRLKIINKILKINNKFIYRVGPVSAIPEKKLKNTKKLSKKLLIRHDSKFIGKKIKFEKYFLIPLHFKINDKDFSSYFKIIKKNYKG